MSVCMVLSTEDRTVMGVCMVLSTEDRTGECMHGAIS